MLRYWFHILSDGIKEKSLVQHLEGDNQFRNTSSLEEKCGEFSMKTKEEKLPNLGFGLKT